VNNWPRQSWQEAEPTRVATERTAMAESAPEMRWTDDGAGGWEGTAPAWPFERDQPAGLERLLKGRRLRLRVAYSEAFPAIEPALRPLDPEPPIQRRTDHAWHINGDGTLCLLRTADLWTGRETAADLVVKAAGWFIEYLLMEAGAIRMMTENGINSDTSLDATITGHLA
jgi:hypothetical protein